MRLHVPDDAAGRRLDSFLADVPQIGSRAVAERLLGTGGVLVDGRVRLKSHKLAGGEEVEFEPPAAPKSTLEPESMDLAVPYEDEHLLIVDKPTGLVVHPAGTRGRARWCTGGSRTTSKVGTSRIARHRAPARPRHIRPARRRASPEAHRRLQELVRRVRSRASTAPSSSGARVAQGGRSTRRSAATAAMRSGIHSTPTLREAVTHFEVEELLKRHAL